MDNMLTKDSGSKNLIIIGSIIAIHLLVFLYLLNILGFYPFFGNKPFILELLKTNFDLPIGVILFSSCLNIFLLFLLTNKLFSRLEASVTIGIYAVSIWSIYLGFFNSLYVLATSFLLLVGLGIVSSKKIRALLIITGIIGLLSLSILFWTPLIIFLGLNIKLRLLNRNLIRYSVFTLLIVQMGLITLGFRDNIYFKQLVLREVTIFNDVGLINTVNTFQGQTREANLGLVARVVENKFTYLPLKVIYNFCANWAPMTFFTPKYKLLSFSNQPPILIGFIIPLAMGLIFFKNKNKLSIVLGLYFMLVIPSILASNSPDLNRLFFAAPLIFIIIGIGTVLLYKSHRRLFLLSSFLIIVQQLMVLSDIYLREPVRLLSMVLRIYGKN